ncbi:MAG: TIGR03086 family metal-binding protein [Candidatus Dormibacter sp.]
MTTAQTDPLATLSRSVDQAGDVIAGVAADQWEMRTPCHEWDVARLVDHVIQSARNGTIRAGGGKTDWTAAPPHADDAAADFRNAGAQLIDAWRDADLEGTVDMPGMGEMPRRFPVDQLTAELAVHTWDLARATGQSTGLDAVVGEAALAWAKGMLKPPMRGEAFGPEVSIDPSASLYDRLAAFFGRDPNRL